jgi:hypothetical protein
MEGGQGYEEAGLEWAEPEVTSLLELQAQGGCEAHMIQKLLCLPRAGASFVLSPNKAMLSPE